MGNNIILLLFVEGKTLVQIIYYYISWIAVIFPDKKNVWHLTAVVKLLNN